MQKKAYNNWYMREVLISDHIYALLRTVIDLTVPLFLYMFIKLKVYIYIYS